MDNETASRNGVVLTLVNVKNKFDNYSSSIEIDKKKHPLLTTNTVTVL